MLFDFVLQITIFGQVHHNAQVQLVIEKCLLTFTITNKKGNFIAHDIFVVNAGQDTNFI